TIALSARPRAVLALDVEDAHARSALVAEGARAADVAHGLLPRAALGGLDRRVLRAGVGGLVALALGDVQERLLEEGGERVDAGVDVRATRALVAGAAGRAGVRGPHGHGDDLARRRIERGPAELGMAARLLEGHLRGADGCDADVLADQARRGRVLRAAL